MMDGNLGHMRLQVPWSLMSENLFCSFQTQLPSVTIDILPFSRFP
jgi:hypothetical protein